MQLDLKLADTLASTLFAAIRDFACLCQPHLSVQVHRHV